MMDGVGFTGFQVPEHAALIAFCGVDGSGKTSQLGALADRLRRNHSVFTTKQPTSAFRSDPLIRAYLEGTMEAEDPALAAEIGPEVGLYAAADRYRHLRTEVMPRLFMGELVLTDRYLFTCYACTGPRGFAPLGWVQEINRYVPHPDLTLFFDVPATVALERIRRRGDTPKWEELNEPRIEAISAEFRSQPWGEDPRYHVLDGTLPMEVLREQVATLADEMLRGKGLPGLVDPEAHRAPQPDPSGSVRG